MFRRLLGLDMHDDVMNMFIDVRKLQGEFSSSFGESRVGTVYRCVACRQSW